MWALEEPLVNSDKYKLIEEGVLENNTPILVSGLDNTDRFFFMNTLSKKSCFKLIVTYSDQRATEIYNNYRFFDRNAYIYPAKDILFYSADIHGNSIVTRRLEILKRIACNEPTTVILTIDALMDKLPTLSHFAKTAYEINSQSIIDLDKLKELLVEYGYEKNDWIDGAGQFSIRGGIIDIFPLTSDCPYRIELWGDEIDSIRSFDVDSQRSIEQLNSITIYPATEIILSDSRIKKGLIKIEAEHKAYAKSLKAEFKMEAYARINKTVAALKEELLEFNGAIGIDSYIEYFYDHIVSFLDYFNDETYIFIDEPDKVATRGEMCVTEFSESMIGRLEGGYILPGQANVLFDYKEILGRIANKRCIALSRLIISPKILTPKISVDFIAKNLMPYNNSFDLLVKDIKEWKKKRYKILFFSPSTTRGRRLAEDFADNDIDAFFSEDNDKILKPSQMMITPGRLTQGFVMDDLNLAVLCEGDIFNDKQKTERKRKQSTYNGQRITSFADLEIGDYVVHEKHGLGIYQGIEKIEVDKVAKDYICIEYSGGSKLFILVSQLDLIQKYAGKEAKKPKLNKLGGQEWEKTKTKVKGQVKEIAGELVELYAIRQSKEGYAFSEDTVWQKEFEELFPYDETYDQLKAIEETKKDMESHKIMDRLICGDVGYGKTEVAIRAAFKAVGDSRQVAYLVPTTILAQQHYESFKERMKDFPVTVRMMSRFNSTKEQKEVVDGLKKGSVDIVIGTHRLLSKDINYKNLGLLIIDEEQRFGVSHKEKIKQLKKDIDVLTLTATPIPRTLHMSLVGIRDMSLLEEPPVDRRAIQTYVLEYDKELVREAINRELARNGQVYYVYNRVNNIEEITSEVQELIPDARVAFAHGQMKERELEDIMYQFINKEIDVLVTTTIIETGLDIANANTMIIHDANNFGLSQLYQLRGRVGRSNRSAYAFLMYKRDTMLKETAEKRLQAIREFTDLGSGFKIAMRDLEIRGAGNLLGADQSGHMAAVGYDLYCKMLNDEVRRLKGEAVSNDYNTSIELPIDAFIPANYVKNELTKLELYKRISQIENEEEQEDMIDEITDRFGNMPQPVINLLDVALLKAICHSLYITELTIKGEYLNILMFPRAKVKVELIDDLLKKYRGKMQLESHDSPMFKVKVGNVLKKDILICVQNVINDIKLLIET